jgi:hypothetical protein
LEDLPQLCYQVTISPGLVKSQPFTDAQLQGMTVTGTERRKLRKLQPMVVEGSWRGDQTVVLEFESVVAARA